MTDNAENQILQAKIESLGRRVAKLETSLHAESPYMYTRQELLSLYVECRLGKAISTEREALLWCSIVNNLDEVTTLDLAMHSGDPFPWRTFLLLLDAYSVQPFGARVRESISRATEHLLKLAQTLLVIQGLSMLEPKDVLMSPMGIERALSTLSDS